MLVAIEIADRGHGTRLRHPPRLQNRKTELLAVRLRQRPRHRRATARDAPQAGRVAARQLGSTCIQIVGTPAATVTFSSTTRSASAGAGQVAAGHDQVGAGRHPGVGQTPRVGVEHRHDGQHTVVLADADAVGHEDGHRVQERAAVAVDDTLRVARGAARVAHARRLILVARWGEIHRRCIGEQLLVIVHGDALDGGQLAGDVVDHHQVAYRLEGRQQWREQGQHRLVDEDDLVGGMIDDVGELFGEQPHVQRVQDAAGARGGKVQLEVAGAVPSERGHPRDRCRCPVRRGRRPRGGCATPTRRRWCAAGRRASR